MPSYKEKKNIFRAAGLNDSEPKSNIVVGGADLSDIKSKEALLEEKIQEARQEAIEKARYIIEEAEEKAQAIIENAEVNKESIRQEAFAKGLEQGQDAGRAEMENQFAELFNLVENILEEVKNEREKCLQDEEARVEKIITKMAHKIIKRDLSINQEISLEYIKSCINSLEHKSTVNILASPQQAEALNQLREKIAAAARIENLSISAETKLDPGDFILESNRERLDLRIDSQFEEILNSL